MKDVVYSTVMLDAETGEVLEHGDSGTYYSAEQALVRAKLEEIGINVGLCEGERVRVVLCTITREWSMD